VNEDRPNVPVWVPFAALGAVLAIVTLIGGTVLALAKASNPKLTSFDDLSQWAQIALTVMQDAIFVFAAWIAVRLARHGAYATDFGLRRPVNARRAVLYAALVFGAFWLVTVLLSAAFGNPPDQELVTDLKDQDQTAVLIGWAVMICAVAPFVEELFFRGFMFTVFAKRMGVAWATPLVGVIFGLGHAPAPAISLVALGVFGAGLCLLYWRSQSIIPGMALHALNNSITFGVVKHLQAGVFVGLVVASVGTVLLAGTAVASRRTVAA
jgi:membrane protease YdiL (CAAX protease family)